MNDKPNDQSLPPQPKAKKKPGFFARLLGTAAEETDIKILIGPFIDAQGQDHAREIANVFSGNKGIFVQVVSEDPVLTPEVNRTDLLPQACTQALGWLSQNDADLVIWGDVPPPGANLFLHFAAPPPVDDDPAGTISPFQSLNLPLGFDPEVFGPLVMSSALAALNPDSDPKRETCRNLIAPALEKSAEMMEQIPREFTPRERASLQAMFANALASFGHLFPGTEVYHRAAQAYGEAIKGTLRSDSPTNWAYLQRNLGTVLQAMGERTDDIDTLSQAEEAYKAALEIFTFEATPFPWATTHNRTGEVLYRMDIKTDEVANLKKALGHYQSALKVLNKRSMPLLWSETLNNFAQTAQVLGRQTDNEDIVEKAVTACKQALSVRSSSKQPTLWAATQNNMGSALFLLGRMTGEDKHYEAALKAFMEARETYDKLGLTRMVEITDKNIAHAEQRLPEGATQSDTKNADMWWLEEE